MTHMSDFKPGDVFLSSANNWRSRIICLGMFSRFSHAAVVVELNEDGPMVLEAVKPQARKCNVNDFLARQKNVWLMKRPEGLDEKQIEALKKYSEEYKGQKYDLIPVWVHILRPIIILSCIIGIAMLVKMPVWNSISYFLILAIATSLGGWVLAKDRRWCDTLVRRLPWLTVNMRQWLFTKNNEHYCSLLVLQLLDKSGVKDMNPRKEITPSGLYRKLKCQGYKKFQIQRNGVLK